MFDYDLDKVDICRLAMSEGSCSNHTDRWYFDHEANECKTFVFKGCNGNENNFETRDKCESQCNGKKGSTILDTSSFLASNYFHFTFSVISFTLL